jgi:hypothetical protein
MWNCNHCHFSHVLDDMVVTTVLGNGLCLRCYLRVTRSALPMPSRLRQQVIEALAAA